MRSLVSRGIERAEGESLSTAETVPGVSPTCLATALSVTTVDVGPVLLVWAMSWFQTSPAGVMETAATYLPNSRRLAIVAATSAFGDLSRFRVPLAVRFRSAQREKQNVEIADDRQKKGVTNPNTIRNRARCERNQRAAHDRHDHHSRTIPGKRPEFRHTERENTREHDGIKKPDQDDAVHGRVSRAQHRDGDQGSGAN